MDTALVEHLVIFKTFFGITAHTADAIENDGVGRFNLPYELVPIWSVLLGSCIEFFNDRGGGVDSSNVGYLTSEPLMLGADAAISIDHNITVLSVLNLTTGCSYAIIMSCFRSFVSGLGAKLVHCLQRLDLVLIRIKNRAIALWAVALF